MGSNQSTLANDYQPYQAPLTLADAQRNAADSSVTGPGTWAIVHQAGLAADENPANLQQFLNIVDFVKNNYKSQHCRKHFSDAIDLNPIKPGQAFKWTVDRHNEVNARHGKKIFTVEEARQIWGPENDIIVPCRDEGGKEFYIQDVSSHYASNDHNPYRVDSWTKPIHKYMQ